MKTNTYIVIKIKDIFKYLTDNQIKYLDAVLNTIADGWKKDGKKTDNSYYICNTDKSYADEVLGVILKAEGGMRSKSQILSKLRADGHITDEEYKMLCSMREFTKEEANAYSKALDVFNEFCESTISRQAVLNTIAKVGLSKNETKEVQAISECLSEVEKLPFIKPQEPSNDKVSRGVFEQIMWERDVAIEQLKELGYEFGERVITDSDIISRKTVKSEYKRQLESNLKDDVRGIDLSEFADCTAFNKFIDDIPSVNPQELNTGHWIVHEIESTLKWLECSNCHCETSYKRMYNYCPNCGAKMVELQ